MSEAFRRVSLFEQLRQILLRRRRIALLAFVVPVACAAGLALFTPRSYRSTAVVVIERGAGVSDDDVDARLSALKSENLGRARLAALIKRFDLYHAKTRRKSLELLIDQMQKDVRIELEKEERAGRGVAVAIQVTYTARDPAIAAQVANELAAFYEREDLRMREHRADYTLDKLRRQLADARQQLDEEEARLKDYKMRHLNELPEQVGLHLAALEQLNSQIHASRIEPNAPPVPPGSRVRRRGSIDRDPRLEQLRELETRFTDEHPDVQRLKREIAMLPYAPDRPADDQLSGSDGQPAPVADKSRAEDIRRRTDALRQAAAAHERGILNAPFRQQELEALLPDYVAARTRFQSLSEKYEIAQLWDPQHDDGRLRVLDAAVPRPEAVAPNVPRIIAAGLALALALVIAVVALVERADTSFHSLDDLRAFTAIPVLASVPRLVSSTDSRRTTQNTRRFVAVVVLLVVSMFVGAAVVGRSDRAFVTGASSSHP